MSTLISQLPEEIRKKAEQRMNESKWVVPDRESLRMAFDWHDTPEGFEYWYYVDKMTQIIDRRLSRNETIDLLVKLWEEGK